MSPGRALFRCGSRAEFLVPSRCYVRNLYTYFGRYANCRSSEKPLQISDMALDSPDLRTALLERVRTGAFRKVWTPGDFVDLASRDAVDKALQRLTKAGTLRRIDRGLYDQPGTNKLTQKANPPDPRSVIDAVGRRDQTRMLVDGMTAANDLGLTDAVPAKIVVHTDARRRAIKLGAVTMTFRPTAASKLFWAGRPAMRVVQALHWLRDTLGREGESEQVQAKLAKLLHDPTHGPPLKADLVDGLAALPTWMRVFLKPLIEADLGDQVRPSGEALSDAGDKGAEQGRRPRSGIPGDQDRAPPAKGPLKTKARPTRSRPAARSAKA